MGFFNNLNEKLQTFMIGRNGSDRLARWSIGIGIVFMLLNIFFSNIIFLAISYACLFYCIFRIFSRDVAARSAEDERFSEFIDRLAFWRKDRQSNSQRNTDARSASRKNSSGRGTDAIYSRRSKADHNADSSKLRIECDSCGQSLSVPKGRGTLKVTCPKCNHQMKVKS